MLCAYFGEPLGVFTKTRDTLAEAEAKRLAEQITAIQPSSIRCRTQPLTFPPLGQDREVGMQLVADVDAEIADDQLNQPLAVPARTSAMHGLGLRLPDGGTIVSSNAEVAEQAQDRIRFAPGPGRDTEVWLRTERTVIATRTE